MLGFLQGTGQPGPGFQLLSQNWLQLLLLPGQWTTGASILWNPLLQGTRGGEGRLSSSISASPISTLLSCSLTELSDSVKPETLRNRQIEKESQISSLEISCNREDDSSAVLDPVEDDDALVLVPSGGAHVSIQGTLLLAVWPATVHYGSGNGNRRIKSSQKLNMILCSVLIEKGSFFF